MGPLCGLSLRGGSDCPAPKWKWKWDTCRLRNVGCRPTTK